MTRSNLALSLVLAAVATGLSPPALAQTSKLQPYDDPVMGCALKFSGQIEVGDSALFDAAVETQAMDSLLGFIGDPGTRICFDSPGGVLSEGIKIAKIIHNRYGTAVPAGAVCESACAVAFMGGSREPEGDPRGGVVDRVLHPEGKLGFHAPSLVVSDGQYNETVVRLAFNTAMASVGTLVANMGTFDFPESLLTRMVSTPADDMFHVTTVGEAARWRITVAPTVQPHAVDALAVFNACSNHYRYLSDFRGVSAFNANEEHYVQIPFFPVEFKTQDGQSEAVLEGFGQEMATICTIFRAPGVHPASPWGWVSMGEGDIVTSSYELYPALFFTRSTLIADLAPVDDRVIEKQDAGDAHEPWSNRIDGHCFLYRGPAPGYDQPCDLQSMATVSGDLTEQYETHVFTAASGTQVRLSLINGAWDVDGQATDLEYSAEFDPTAQQRLEEVGKALGGQGWFVNCFGIPADGKRFCFLGHAPEEGLVQYNPWNTSIQIFR